MANKLGKNIQKYRKQNDLTQEELAEKLKISRTHMGHIEQGDRNPSIGLLNRIAKVLKTSVKDLV